VVGAAVDLAPGDDRRGGVEQVDQPTDQPRLRLAPFAEQDQVLTGEQRPFELGQHRVVVADDAGGQRVAGPQPGDQVGRAAPP
jgi:hypothetical protein